MIKYVLCLLLIYECIVIMSGVAVMKSAEAAFEQYYTPGMLK